jgi:hypothetical protein
MTLALRLCLWAGISCLLAGGEHTSSGGQEPGLVGFFHPLPGACFPSRNAPAASVSAASGLFQAAGSRPLRWRLLLNAHESAAGDLSAGSPEDGESTDTCSARRPRAHRTAARLLVPGLLRSR